ncbi:MAG: ATP-binding protein [Ruminococcaceae bacterium]|nr:ATP-binding protein [Oscillospiraceae bacterium]
MSDTTNYGNLSIQLHALALFRGLLFQPVPARFLALLDAMDEPHLPRRADLYCEFVAALYAEGGDFGAHLLRLVLESDNPAVRLKAAGQQLPAEMAACLTTELAVLDRLSRIDPAGLKRLVGGEHPLPAFASTAQDFTAVYTERLATITTKGYGIFSVYHMFTLGQGSCLLPVKNPDPQRLAELTGYDAERRQVLVNTRALLRGLPASNILLYGDAGTGKSSTVKAVVNEFAPYGLRLVEVRKNQLYQIPLLMDALADNPLKFILFIDDLSFPADDGDFTALKAILEGNVSARPQNLVVYATSNRRHMVKERFADRAGGDVHLSDTLEEEASLSARFGLTITFLKPDRELYTTIVAQLAKEHGVTLPREALLEKAEAHAIRYGGRSPRTARQFVENLLATQDAETDL